MHTDTPITSPIIIPPSPPHPDIILGDCFELVRSIPPASVNLFVFSPPYADQRKATSFSIAPDDYVAWFLPLAADIWSALASTGSLIINIKEKVLNGERHTYVLELILAMREIGWLWTEEYIWHKANAIPGKWPNRLRDAWERCLHFTKQKHFYMDQDAVKVPIGDWALARLKNLSDNDKTRWRNHTESGFGRNMANWVGKELVLPDNVLHFATESGNRGHSAVFPEKLPEFFIKLFTKPDDLVVDPFLGSGTTAVVAQRLKRRFLGFEIKPEYFQVAQERISA